MVALTDSFCAVGKAVGASSGHGRTGTLLVAVIDEGYLLPRLIRLGMDLPVLIAGNSHFDEAVEAAENFVKFFFVDM